MKIEKKIYVRDLAFKKKVKGFRLLGGKCNICSEKDIRCIDFHHIDKSEKSAGINHLRNNKWEILESEIKKCILLCTNCHRKEHKNDITKRFARKNKEVFLLYKNTFECNLCGFSDDICCLDFHHFNKEEKEFSIGNETIFKRFESISDLPFYLKKELDKCVVLCGNCHRKEHSEYRSVDIDVEYRSVKKFDPTKVIELRVSGLSYNEISKTLNIAKSSINNILRKYNLIDSCTKFNSTNPKVRKKEPKEFRRKYNLPEFSVSFLFQLNTFIFLNQT